MRLPRIRTILAIATVAATAASGAHPTQAAPPASPELGALVSGTSQYVDGTYVWTDYAYDDQGTSYPSGKTNAGDLIQLQVGLDQDALTLRAILETLTDATTPKIAIGFDTDDDAVTGLEELPDFKPMRGPAGADLVITVSNDGVHVADISGTLFEGPASIDVSANTIEARIPRTSLDPGTEAWRAIAATGVRGSTTVNDLAFVGDEAASGWQNARQNAVIAGTTPVRNGSAIIDFAKVSSGADEAPDFTSPGFHTMLYHSRLNLPEGIGAFPLTAPGGFQGQLGNLYAGPYQPYLVWLPEELPEDPPLIVYMHGLSGTHTSSAGQFGPVTPPSQPQDQFLGSGGFQPDAVVAMPLGRGEQSFYLGVAEQDVLDVTDDAIARYGVDPDRVVLAGVSMGGFGAYRIGILRPDRWSAIVPLIGTARSAQALMTPPLANPTPELESVFSPSGFPSGAGEMLGNLANVPVRAVNGQVDPIVNYSFAVQDAAWMTQFGIDHRSWVLQRRQHEVVPSITNCVLQQAISLRRDPDPRAVRLAIEPGTFAADPATGLDLHYDQAYWVTGIRLRSGASYGSVSARSGASDKPEVSSSILLDANDNLTTGRDLCGENAATVTGDSWRMTGLEHVPAPGDRFNELSLDLLEVAELTVDLARAKLDPTQGITLFEGGTGEVTMHLRADWPGDVDVIVNGEELIRATPVDGLITFTVDLTTPDNSIALIPA